MRSKVQDQNNYAPKFSIRNFEQHCECQYIILLTDCLAVRKAMKYLLNDNTGCSAIRCKYTSNASCLFFTNSLLNLSNRCRLCLAGSG